MSRLRALYSPKLPWKLALHAQSLNYDSEKFLSRYTDRMAGKPVSSIEQSKLRRSALFLVWTTYYIWLAYILSALMIALINPLVGIVALTISPFIAVGYAYSYVYLYEKLFISLKRRSKKPAETTKKHRRKVG